MSYSKGEIEEWKVEGTVDLTGTFWKAASGLQSLDLIGSSPGAIVREFATIPGQTYELCFGVSGNPHGGDPIKIMEVWWNATLLDRIAVDITGRSLKQMGWAWRGYGLVAREQTARLKFQGVAGGSHWGPVLDDVTVAIGSSGCKGEVKLVTLPTPTPVPIATPTMTPVPATPAVLQTPTPLPAPTPRVSGVGKNEMVLFDGEVSRDEEIMPGATPKQFHLFLGGCGCKRSLTVEVIKLDPNQGQGDLQKAIRLEFPKGKAVAEGEEFSVPYNGISVYVFVWANPGTKSGSFERVIARMHEEGNRVAWVDLAEGLKIPESLSILNLVYQPFGDGVTGSVWIKNKSPRSQTIHSLKVSNCNFSEKVSPRFSKDGDIVILPGYILSLNINITIPAGTQLTGVVFCVFTFERKVETLTLEQLIN